MKSFLTWLEDKFSPGKADSSQQTRKPARRVRPVRARPKAKPRSKPQEPAMVELNPGSVGTIEDGGSGKNVLVRNKYVREDTGTHETLKILDDSVLESDEEGEFDPYNTGQFDRSKSWNLRNRK